MGFTAADEEVGGDEGAQTENGQHPKGQGDVHSASGTSYGNCQQLSVSSLPEALRGGGPQVASAPITVQEDPREGKEKPKIPVQMPYACRA
ncbi:hypothetical protein GCM10009544_61210 [Streptomyces stramineus]|uniref:Uncharacterized protein n=1 Tax=Streptomyces stramineus TaxID=173861 RepID=A0ABP3L391_9ACTN